MKIIVYINKALNLPPKELVYKTISVIKRELEEMIRRLLDMINTTFLYNYNHKSDELFQYVKAPSNNHIAKHQNQIISLSRLFISHQFDILGSGWINVKHGMKCPGIHGHHYKMGNHVHADLKGLWLDKRINKSNRAESKRIWSTISDTTYKPIDWQIDFKSGYRWSEKCWYKNIKYGTLPGVDVKIPRELSRMHHLIQFAFAYGITHKNTYILEFRSQILDFIATNPPRYGVNWECTMDVAIRIANWLIAYDFFVSNGASFDDTFMSIFKNSVYEHGSHIISNLEWNEELRGNHYLSNIVGLVFVAAYLPSSYETDLWLSFAVHELINEVNLQFNSDGTNFEASTCYHRLSSELVIYATALIFGLSKQKINGLKAYDPKKIYKVFKIKVSKKPLYASDQNNTNTKRIFPSKYLEQLEKMAEFTMHITKMNNQVSQIGDNDSGRFFKIQSVYSQLTVKDAKSVFSNLINYKEQHDDEIFWFENHLDHRHIVAAINGLFDREDFSTFSKGFYEDIIIAQLSGNTILKSDITKNKAEKICIGTSEDRKIFSEKYQTYMEAICPIHFELPEGAIQNLKTMSYPDFGLYIIRSSRLYISIRCGTIGQNGNGGHAHNDQLSLELYIDGNEIIRDPGTYVYTPFPAMRNRYRSVMAHFVPVLTDCVAENLDMNLFTLKSIDSAKCIYFGNKGFIGTHCEWKSPVFRYIQLHTSGLDIYDFSIGSNAKFENNLNVYSGYVTFSDGYGIAKI